MTKISHQEWVASGLLDLYQLQLELGTLELVQEGSGYVSVAGLLLDKLEGQVDVGSTLTYEGIYFEIIEMDGTRIKKVKIIYPM